MSGTDRRQVLRLAMLASLAPTFLPPSIAAAAPGLIAPPAGAMHYRRRLERGLAGGARIVVSREFRIAFRQVAAGFVIEGYQIGVETDFPPGLERFAELEAARPPEDTFPLLLDPFGRITSSGRAATTDAAISQALEEAMARIERQPIATDQRQELVQFIETLHQAGSAVVAQLPLDLFAPSQTDRSDQQDIALPTGETGRVSSHFVAARDSTTGLMREALREVRTEIAGDQRQTRESWRLTPA